MLGRFLSLIVFVFAGWLLSRLLGGMTRPQGRRASGAAPGARQAPQGPSESMVRDRVCNTFLPRSRALVTRIGAEEHFFCSEACRRRFVEGVEADAAGHA